MPSRDSDGPFGECILRNLDMFRRRHKDMRYYINISNRKMTLDQSLDFINAQELAIAEEIWS